MYINRYASDSKIDDGKIMGTNGAIKRLRDALSNGSITTREMVIQEGDRLDAIAGRFYGDGRLWWVIAVSSNIGWWMQVPPGTRLLIPTDISQVRGLI